MPLPDADAGCLNGNPHPLALFLKLGGASLEFTGKFLCSDPCVHPASDLDGYRHHAFGLLLLAENGNERDVPVGIAVGVMDMHVTFGENDVFVQHMVAAAKIVAAEAVTE